jgi:glycosyltransferase involved in cell wall biosynthesis
MKVLWISPWLRSLSRVHTDALQSIGLQTLLITSDRHPESDAVRPGELLVEQSLRHAASWLGFTRAYRAARHFAPDVVVFELVRDPRWLAFTRLAPVVTLVHDDVPHDTTEQPPRWVRALRAHLSGRATRVVTFSRYVAEQLERSGQQVSSVPLTSDLDDSLVPDLVSADQRRDFVLIGRPGPYKNVPVLLDAWRLHRSGPGWRGDDLIIIGGGATPTDLPDSVRWQGGQYRYVDVVQTVAQAKGSVVHYRSASQSGAQMLAMQLGVTPIVSTAGGLAEAQPPGEIALGIDDVPGLAAALDSLADPVVAAARGEAAATHYRRNYRSERSADALRAVFEDLLR